VESDTCTIEVRTPSGWQVVVDRVGVSDMVNGENWTNAVNGFDLATVSMLKNWRAIGLAANRFSKIILGCDAC